MNKEVRTKLESVSKELSDIQSNLESIAVDEENKFDNLSEGLQQSDRGQAMQQAADELNEAASYVESAAQELQNAIEMIDSVTSA